MDKLELQEYCKQVFGSSRVEVKEFARLLYEENPRRIYHSPVSLRDYNLIKYNLPEGSIFYGGIYIHRTLYMEDLREFIVLNPKDVSYSHEKFKTPMCSVVLNGNLNEMKADFYGVANRYAALGQVQGFQPRYDISGVSGNISTAMSFVKPYYLPLDRGWYDSTIVLKERVIDSFDYGISNHPDHIFSTVVELRGFIAQMF